MNFSIFERMDLQARILSIIDRVLHLRDEAYFFELEKMYQKYTYIHPPAVTDEEMYPRQVKSIKQIEKGEIKSHIEVKKHFGF